MNACSTPALELVDVVKRYPGDPPVESLRGVSLRIDPNEMIAVMGPSGSGKTTLLHIMGTLERPTSGWVRITGEDCAGLQDRDLSGLRSRRLGFVFQQSFLMDGMTAVENVANGLLYCGTPPSQRLLLARESLTRVGLAHRLSHVPAKLSGGERQRVAIARALVGRPAVILADEPTGNLDSATGAEIVKLLLELHREGTTLVVITHSVDVASAAPRLVEIRDGLIIHDSRPAA
jgi:putative ABC transport system ATP-binding protein